MTELKPSKFGIIPGKGPEVAPNKKPDQFGQVLSADEDSAAAGNSSPIEVTRLHARSDVDSNRRAQHHTLGNTRNQAAPGDHIHDGINGKKLGLYVMDTGKPGQTKPSLVLTGSKGGNTALTSLIALLKNFIDFTDNTT